jgi:hypothetical protein
MYVLYIFAIKSSAFRGWGWGDTAAAWHYRKMSGRRRSYRSFEPSDKAELLTALEPCRKACIHAITKAPIDSEVYRRTSKLIDAIDDVAQELTGSREYFHLPAHKAPS